MSGFTTTTASESEHGSAPIAFKLHNSVRNSPPRGGSAVAEVQGNVLMFGGTDREQINYQDLIGYEKNRADGKSSYFDKIEVTGDIPMPRSGHSLVSYGKYALAFGGIDYGEEIAFNDLYILNTENMEWGYVGESGAEIVARNAHSMCILNYEDAFFLVLYGGASPEHGAMGDVVYARLPDASTIDPKSFFVEWTILEPVTGVPQPGGREMHSTSAVYNSMIIAGGRNNQGEVLRDVWSLSVSRIVTSGSSSSGSTSSNNEFQFQWEQWPESSFLPDRRCAHVSCFVSSPLGISRSEWKLSIFGGFKNDGVSGEVLSLSLDWDAVSRRVVPSRNSNGSAATWQTVAFANGPPARFGHALCPLSGAFLLDLWQNSRYKPLLERAHLAETMATLELAEKDSGLLDDTVARIRAKVDSGHRAAFLFGGVCIEQDFADIWVLVF